MGATKKLDATFGVTIAKLSKHSRNIRKNMCYVLRSVESFGWVYLTVIGGCVPLLSCYLESEDHVRGYSSFRLST
jgi:hypothetical protein